MATQSKQKKVKGGRQKLKLFRSNEPLKSVLMWGVNYSLTQMNHVKPRVVLLADDFKASIKVKVHNQFFNKENMPSRYKFKEYCPLVFQNLRERFDVSSKDYLNSFTKKQPVWGPDKKFLITHDNRYVIEIITTEDVEQVHHLLEPYHEYIVNFFGQTLLPRVLAMYRLIVADQIYYMLVTKNTLSPRLPVYKKYQLKGCTVDREASVKEKAKPHPTFKDLDFTNDGCKIEIGTTERDRIMDLLTKDIEFLESNNMMSYSLMVAIHDPDQEETPSGNQANQTHSMSQQQNQHHHHAVSSGAAGDSNFFASDEDVGVASPGEEDYPLDEDSDISDVIPSNVVALDGSMSRGTGPMSPPDSPGLPSNSYPAFTGELDSDLEQFAIKSSKNASVIYFLGLMHIFTRYGMKKRTAKTYKSVRHGGHRTEISTVKPELYAKRFLEFISANIE